jgi:uncharacterized protein HemX
MVAVSFPLLLISVFVTSILPSAGGIAIVTLFLVALGIGLMHDSTYQPKRKTLPHNHQQRPKHQTTASNAEHNSTRGQNSVAHAGIQSQTGKTQTSPTPSKSLVQIRLTLLRRRF